MRYLSHSIRSNTSAVIDELDNLSFEEIKKVVKDVLRENDNLMKVTERAAIALDQYKELVSLIDGIIVDDGEASKEKTKNSIAEIFLRLIFSMKNTSYWLMMLSDLVEKYSSEDNKIHNLVLVLKEMSKGILLASRRLKHPTKRKKCTFVRNFERSKEKNGGRKLEKNVSSSSPINLAENEEEKNGSTAQNNSEVMDEGPSEPILVNIETLDEEDAKSEDERAVTSSDKAESEAASEVEIEKLDDELEENTMELSADDASESDTNEGEKYATERSPQNQKKKKEKTFGISYFKTENLFRNGVVESNKAYQSISKGKNRSSNNYAFKCNLKKNSLLSNTSRIGLNKSENSHLHSDSKTVSKGPRRYGRKRRLSSNEEDTNVNSMGQSENDTLERMPKKQRQSSLNSNKGGENEPTCRRKSRKDSFNFEPETTTKCYISSVQPKKRGRRRKMDIMQQGVMENRDRNDYTLKYACVHLINVLDDPNVQHYVDVNRMSHKKKKESLRLKEKQKKSRVKGETDENSLGKETNEIDVEWNVLDAVSDEDEKDIDNKDESGEVNSDNDDQVSESEADHEQAEDDNNPEQPDDEELNNGVETEQTDERCQSVCGDESSNHSEPLSETKQHTEGCSNPNVSSQDESDSEIKCPKSSSPTPNSHHVSSPEVFHMEDENDAEEESIKSDEEDGCKTPSSSSKPSRYGKKGPRTPPTPSPTWNFIRGPRTPPGFPEVSEDEENALSSD